jgi:hypothetical protein
MSGSVEIRETMILPQSRKFEEQAASFKIRQKELEKKLEESQNSHKEFKMRDKKLGSYTFYIPRGGDEIIDNIKDFAEGKVPPNILEI